MGHNGSKFKIDSDQIVFDDRVHHEIVDHPSELPALNFEVAGPREHLYFDSAKTTAAIVTCGGLCPGLNDVIRGIVMELWHGYGVTKILGIRHGYEGLIPKHGHPPLQLRPETVSSIQTFGGTMLGTSRGHQNVNEMVDALEQLEIDVLFVVGGGWHSQRRRRPRCGDPSSRSSQKHHWNTQNDRQRHPIPGQEFWF